MRCVDVIRELAAPTSGPEPAGLAEHLANCPRCAAWAGRDAQLGRLWEATRPPGPPAGAWDALWANVSAGHQSSSASSPAATHPALPRRGRHVALTMVALAQAAAILATIFVLSRPDRRASPPPTPTVVATVQPTPNPSPSPTLKIVIDQGAPVIFSPDGQVRTLARNENSDTVDRYLTMFNAVEAMASMQ